MQVSQGGALYGFCPAKATWDFQANQIFKMLVISAECGIMYTAGGIEDQPSWYFDLCAHFIPRYHDFKFNSRVKMVLGDGKSQGANYGRNTRSTNR